MTISAVFLGASILVSRVIGHTQQEPTLVADNTNEQTISSFDNARTNQGLSSPINQEQVQISSVPLFFRKSLQDAHRTQQCSLTPRFSLLGHPCFSRTFNTTFGNPQNTPLLITMPTNETRTDQEAQVEEKQVEISYVPLFFRKSLQDAHRTQRYSLKPIFSLSRDLYFSRTFNTTFRNPQNTPLLITMPTNETRTDQEAQVKETNSSQALTNTPSTQNQNQNTIQVEEKTLSAYNKFKSSTDRISETEPQNLYAMPSNNTNKEEAENLDNGFQKLGAKLLQEALPEEDKPILLITMPTNETRTDQEEQVEETNSSQALTNTPSTQNQNQNTIQVEKKTLWAYNKFESSTDRISDTDLQNLYAMTSNSTNKKKAENPDNKFQRLGAKLLEEALAEKDKPILRSFYKFMNCFPTKLWTSYDWKTSREIRIEFGKKLILQSTSPEKKEEIITTLFKEKDHRAIRQILS